MKFCLYSSYLIDVFIMLIIKQSETAGQKRLFQKINDLEIEVRRENVRRQEEIRGLQQSVDRIEEQLNNTVSILDKALTALTDTKMVGTQIVNDPKDVGKIGNEQTNSGKLGEVLGAFKILNRGFSEEKKETSRLRRQVTEIQSEIDIQRNISMTLSDAVSSILCVLNDTQKGNNEIKETAVTITDVLNDIKNDVSDLKENGILMSSEIKLAKQMCSTTKETLEIDVVDRLENLKMIGNAVNDTCCKEDLKLLRNQLIDVKREHPVSCKEIHNAVGYKSDVNLLSNKVKVYCDQDTDGGGWIVFQRRQDGSVDFFRDWADYKNGFGSLTGEFWLGNDNIYRLLTTSKQYELRIDMGDFEGNSAYAKYSSFRIGPESEGYKLEVGGYSGNAGDSLEYHNGQTFKTKDHFGKSDFCTRNWKSGWWYNNCHRANLNGVYNSTTIYEGIIWKHWKGFKYSLRFVEMKFRERN